MSAEASEMSGYLLLGLLGLAYLSGIADVGWTIIRLASGFAACGKLFSSLFGMAYMVAMIISAIIIVGYTAVGGFLVASTKDFIQSIIMTIAILLVLGFATAHVGVVDVVMGNAKSLPGYFSMTTTHLTDSNSSVPYGLLQIISTLA